MLDFAMLRCGRAQALGPNDLGSNPDSTIYWLDEFRKLNMQLGRTDVWNSSAVVQICGTLKIAPST